MEKQEQTAKKSELSEKETAFVDTGITVGGHCEPVQKIKLNELSWKTFSELLLDQYRHPKKIIANDNESMPKHVFNEAYNIESNTHKTGHILKDGIPKPLDPIQSFNLTHNSANTLVGMRPPWSIDNPQPAIKELIALNPWNIHSKIIEFGSGTGENLCYFASKGYHGIGLDYIPKAVDLANHKAGERLLLGNIRFWEGDVTDTPTTTTILRAIYPSGYDIAIDSALLHCLSIDDSVKYVNTIRNVLKDNGKLYILAISDQEDLFKDLRCVSKERIHQLFNNNTGFKVISIEPAEYHIKIQPEVNIFNRPLKAYISEIQKLPTNQQQQQSQQPEAAKQQ